MSGLHPPILGVGKRLKVAEVRKETINGQHGMSPRPYVVTFKGMGKIWHKLKTGTLNSESVPHTRDTGLSGRGHAGLPLLQHTPAPICVV